MADSIPQLIAISEKVGGIDQRVQSLEQTSQQVLTEMVDIREMLRSLGVHSEDHREHHEYLTTVIAEKKQVIELRKEILSKIITGGALAALTGIASLLWLGIKTKYSIGD